MTNKRTMRLEKLNARNTHTTRLRDAAPVSTAEKSATARVGQDAPYTYLDCLCDEAPAPTGTNGTTLYQALSVGGLVVFVVTANGIRNSGIDFLEQPH